MLNWSSFNESKSSNHELNLELLQDYFLSIEDLGYKLSIELAVYQNEYWVGMSDCELDVVSGVGFCVRVDNIFSDQENSSKWEMSGLERFSKLISEITGICKRITINYKCELLTSIDDWAMNIFFIKSGTLHDACYISHRFLMDYISEILNHIAGSDTKSDYLSFRPGIREPDVNFITKDKNCFIEFIANDKYSGMSANDFKSRFEDAMNSIYGGYKYDSIEKFKNKFIIKNFISIDDIKFQY